MTEILAATEPSRDPWLFTFVMHAPFWMRMVVAIAAGVVVGQGLVFWFLRMDLPEGIWTAEGESSPQNAIRKRAVLAVELATGALFAGLVYVSSI